VVTRGKSQDTPFLVAGYRKLHWSSLKKRFLGVGLRMKGDHRKALGLRPRVLCGRRDLRSGDPGGWGGEGGVRTGHGLGRRGLCSVLGPGRGTNRGREESPKEDRDPDHFNCYATGGEGPGAQPHRVHPLGREAEPQPHPKPCGVTAAPR
jgi:hypothetical protein